MPRLTRIYTRKGDDGSTGLGGGQRVAKDSPRVAAYGTVDELNSAIGVALAHGLVPRLARRCRRSRTSCSTSARTCASSRKTRASGRSRRSSRATSTRSRPLIDELNEVVGAARQLHPAGRLPGRRTPARRPHHLPPRRARRADAVAPRADRQARDAVPESPVRRAVRDGALREPPARRRRAALGREGLTPRVGAATFPPPTGKLARRRPPSLVGTASHRPERVALPLHPGWCHAPSGCRIQSARHAAARPARRHAGGRLRSRVVRLRRPRRPARHQLQPSRPGA